MIEGWMEGRMEGERGMMGECELRDINKKK